jgi:hypothetical protein
MKQAIETASTTRAPGAPLAAARFAYWWRFS